MGDTTAVLVPSNQRLTVSGARRTRIGGADMRFISLYRALEATHGCRWVESQCERSTVCRTRCLITDRERPDAADPWYYDRTFCPAAADRLADELIADGIRMVVCSSLNVYRYVIHLSARAELDVIFDMHNVESVLYRTMQRELRRGSPVDAVLTEENVTRMADAERAAIEAATEVWTCSEEDRALATDEYGLGPGTVIRVVPDVVDVPAEVPPAGPPTKVVFTARLDYFPNVLAAEVLLRDIAPALAPIPVVVAGAQPDSSLYDIALPDNARIVADPESMAEIRRDAVMAVPLTHGGGSRFKLIEAFAEGLPVISTLKGAEGLGAEPDVHYLRAETAQEFAVAVRRLQTDHALRTAVVRAGWELARDKHSQHALTMQLGALL